MEKIHWTPTHDIILPTGTRLRGWPVCCSGDRCVKLKQRGMTNPNLEHVTCRQCQRVAEAAEKYTRSRVP